MVSDFVIVGSGAAGMAAALAVAGRNTAVIDVGHRPPPPQLGGSWHELRGTAPDLSEPLLGPRLESVRNVFEPYLSPKLKAPLLRFVTEGAANLLPIRARGFEAVASFAAGGLANVWGAGLYRYTDTDLRGFPLREGDLAPHYRRLTEEVGISGADDALHPFFGPSEGLLPPMRLSPVFARLLRRFERRPSVARAGLHLGRPRLGVLTVPHRGRPAYAYDGLDFFQAGDPAVYSPAVTLADLVSRGLITYSAGLLVERYEERSDVVEVHARDLAGGGHVALRCRRLLLAAGTLGSARLVLRSRRDFHVRLPLLDNAVSYIPLVDPFAIGAREEPRFFPGVSLNAVYLPAGATEPVQMSLYGMGGVLKSDFAFEFPLALRGVLAAARLLSPALAIAQVFHPDAPRPSSYVRLGEDEALEIVYTRGNLASVERQVLPLFRRLCLFGLPSLCRTLAPGSSFHYAGTLPMTERPRGPYETDALGRPAGVGRVHVVDASVFPRLPSKNHSFTMMANAHRVGTLLAEERS
jgi:choline dehydrogenase-like flavoprotein